jgi:hypothetical protein
MNGMSLKRIIIGLTMTIAACGRTPELPPLSASDSLVIVQDNLDHRAEADSFFRSDQGSPFVRDTTIEYHGVKWFPIDARYRGQSILHRYQRADTVIVMGTKGEERKQLRYGYFEFVVPDEHGTPTTLRLNVYKFTPYDKRRYELYKDNLSVWFTDKTTGKETYDVGRYVEIGNENSDPAHVYTIDLNKAYNPYCAYSSLYSCAVPRKEDRLTIALHVGEMKYHD